MSTDLATTTVVHPFTGETLQLERAETNDLGWFLNEMREYEMRLKEAKRAVTDEALRRLDHQAKWTFRTPDFTLKAPSPAPSEQFDELALRSDLWELVDQGVITEEAAGAAVETVVTYKTRIAGINALRKLGGQVAEVIDRHCTPVQKTRYVSVTPNRGQ